MPYWMSRETVEANEQALEQLKAQMGPAAAALAEQMAKEEEESDWVVLPDGSRYDPTF